jgi:hypothetical protein
MIQRAIRLHTMKLPDAEIPRPSPSARDNARHWVPGKCGRGTAATKKAPGNIEGRGQRQGMVCEILHTLGGKRIDCAGIYLTRISLARGGVNVYMVYEPTKYSCVVLQSGQQDESPSSPAKAGYI